jgi:hypothetical protein
VIPVKIHSSVVAIQGWEFVHRMQLTTAILNDELKEIGEGGISSLHIAGTHRDTRRSRDDRGGGIRSLPGVDECDSGGWAGGDWEGRVQKVHIAQEHRHTRRRQDDSEWSILRLLGVDDCHSRRWIGGDPGEGIRWCTFLKSIVITNAVKTIRNVAFRSCMGPMPVILNEGLEKIGQWAYGWCTGLQRIAIPNAVKVIGDGAFICCSNLTRVTFCNEIEEFLSCKAMRGWWNKGLHEKSLSMYCFLVKYGIPDRLGLVQGRCLRANIYEMQRRIPTFARGCLNAYFDTIHSKLTLNENLIKAHGEALMLLGLAIPNDDIVLRVLSFLL